MLVDLLITYIFYLFNLLSNYLFSYLFIHLFIHSSTYLKQTQGYFLVNL